MRKLRMKRQRRGWRRILGSCGVPLSICAALGCEPQAGDGYTGEPLFSLRGEVVLTEPGIGDLVPALAFTFHSSEDQYTLLDVDVQGDFPARFRLDVMEPPPPSAFIRKEELGMTELKGEVAVGFIVVVPREHPRTIPMLLDGSSPGASSRECNEDESVCTKREERCTHDERCVQRTLECIREDCPVISSTDPAAIEELSKSGGLHVECFMDVCMTVHRFCGPNNDCEREIRKCDTNRTTARTTIWDGTYETCEVTAQSGDTSLSRYEYLDRVRDFHLVYWTEANGTLERGYHLVELLQPSDEDWVARLHCEDEAELTALNEYNRINGTNETAENGIPSDVADAIEPEVARLRAECPQAGTLTTRRVDDPLEQGLTLTVSREFAGGS